MKTRTFARWVAHAITLLCVIPSLAHAAQNRIALTGHVPAAALAAASAVNPVADGEPVALALTLPLRNETELDDLIQRLHNPSDPLYGKYLTSDEFTQRFSPTAAQYQAAIWFARANGFTITQPYANRLVLDVIAPAATAESAFAVRLQNYQQPDGRLFHAPDREPSVPGEMQGILSDVIGLDNATLWTTHNFLVTPANIAANPNQIGSGPGGALSPSDIRAAYGLTNVTRTGAGQTLALFQLDGYSASDIAAYRQKYALPNVPLQNVFVGGATGPTGNLSGQGEVTLDIELMMALAPGASKIIVYQAPNTSAGVLACYNKIADDNLAKSISTSWGTPELMLPADILEAENAIFKQMAAQGQSIFAASGDCGAYDNGLILSVDDPAAQPYVTGVGGTTLTTTKAGGPWASEKAWSKATDHTRSLLGAGSGGGVSNYWPLPAYQSGIITSASKGSTQQRNIPDVSLASDPASGYSIYFNNAWYIYGGTSCAAPLWAAFAALVNEQRADAGLGTLGFANPALYSIGKGASYASDFHDTITGTNLFYPAVSGYDLATGWGSFIGANLLNDLAPAPAKPAPTALPAPASLTAAAGAKQVFLSWGAVTGATSYNLYRGTVSGAEAATPIKTGITGTSVSDIGLTNGTSYYYKVTAVNASGESALSGEANATPATTAFLQLLGDPSFESGGASPTPWVSTSGVITPSAAYSGAWKATICGAGVSDSLYQQATIPATAVTATLTFALWVTTTDTTTAGRDLLKVEVRDAATGAVLGALGSACNLNKTSGYITKTYNLNAYKGKTIQIWLYDRQDAVMPTTFNVDSFALNVQ